MGNKKTKAQCAATKAREIEKAAAEKIQDRLVGIVLCQVRAGALRRAQGLVSAIDAIDEMYFQLPF